MHDCRFTILESAEDTLGEYLRVEELIRAGSPGWCSICRNKLELINVTLRVLVASRMKDD